MLTTPSLKDILGGLDILELVQAVPQENDASALLELLCKVDDIQLPILSGKDLVSSIFQPPQVENAEELAALFFIKLGGAEVC